MSDCLFKKEIALSLVKGRSPVTFVHRRTLPREKDFVLHLNRHVELYIYLSGDVDYIVENEYIPLERGDAVVILPHEVHVPVIRSEKEYERIYMLLHADTFSALVPNPHTGLSSIRHHKISLQGKERKDFLDLLLHISDLSDAAETEAGQAQMLGLFLQAYGLLLGGAGRVEVLDEPRLSSGIPQTVRDVLNYIGENIQEIGSVEAVARHFYLSSQYLSSLFKKHVGIRIHEYLQIKRIALAKILLKGEASVAEVAFACGFSDSSHFIRIFKRYVGITPKQYKSKVC